MISSSSPSPPVPSSRPITISGSGRAYWADRSAQPDGPPFSDSTVISSSAYRRTDCSSAFASGRVRSWNARRPSLQALRSRVESAPSRNAELSDSTTGSIGQSAGTAPSR